MSTAVRAKADALFELFTSEVAAHCPELELLTPRNPKKRGTQVSLRHPEAYAIMQALIARGVIGDFRAPDILRFGFAPLYVRHAEIWHAVDHLRTVMESGEWDRPEFHARASVT